MNFLTVDLCLLFKQTRGCPFSCTFCTEGQTYWSKVRRKDESLISNEIKWINKLITSPNNKDSGDLLIV